jgi:hypothetical protein
MRSMVKRKSAILFFLMVPCALGMAADDTQIQFLTKGEALKVMTVESLRQLQKDEVLTVFEPHENTKKNYRGFSVLPLIENIYGKDKMSNLNTLVFYCSDGYRSDVSLEEFKKKKALLSFAMADGTAFVLKNKTPIPLGPYYLTWDHPDALSAKKDFFRWPYAINKIDLINDVSAYAPLKPPEGSSSAIQAGHQAYLKNCFSCHSLNSVGGARGPAIDYFVKTLSSTNLQKIILDPKSVNPNAQMEGLPLSLKNRHIVSKHIVEYLKKIQK